MNPCDTVQSHLSALMDGELEPLESIAVRRHLDRCAPCAAEYRSLEQLKVALHVGGSKYPTPDLAVTRYRRVVREAAAEEAARQRSVRWLVPLAAAAALVVGILAVASAGSSDVPRTVEVVRAEAPAAPLPAAPLVVLDDETLALLVASHRAGPEERGPLESIVSAGALMAFESLPGGFILAEGQRPRVTLASYANCDVRDDEEGSSLAMLRADRVELPSDIRTSLEAVGVYVAVIDGIEVRISAAGERVVVLLSPLSPETSI